MALASINCWAKAGRRGALSNGEPNALDRYLVAALEFHGINRTSSRFGPARIPMKPRTSVFHPKTARELREPRPTNPDVRIDVAPNELGAQADLKGALSASLGVRENDKPAPVTPHVSSPSLSPAPR